MATIEEAIHCPKCGQAGKEVKKESGPKGSKVYVFHCQNPVCTWYDTGWTVQVNADGTVPERKPGEKEFPTLTVYERAFAQRLIDELREGK